MGSELILLNFAHPLTDRHLTQVKALIKQPIQVIDVSVQVDVSAPLAEQIIAIVDRISLSPAQWQTEPLLVNPPSYTPAATMLLAELHGRMGYFPSILWLRPVADSVPTRYEVAEVVNLQLVREDARRRR